MASALARPAASPAPTPPALSRPSTSPTTWALVFMVAIVLREAAIWWHGPSFSGGRVGMWQLLSPEDLRMPWTSLLYMHHQPPLWNALLWVSQRLLGDHTLFWLANKVATYVTALCIRQLLVPWAGPSRANIAALVFLFLPETIAYEAWDYSTHFTMALVALNILSFSLMVRHPDQRVRHAWGWAASMLALAFTRQTYSVVFLLGLVWVFGMGVLKIPRKQLVAISLVLAVPLVAWQAKNEWLFGSAAMSSWMPMNVYKIATVRLSPEQLQADEAAGCGPVTTIKPFSLPETYEHIPEVKSYVAAHQSIAPYMPQSQEGYNSLTYAAIAPLYKHALICALKRHPMVYLSTVAQAWGMYFTPATDYTYIKPSIAPWAAYDKAVRLLVYWQPMSDVVHERSALRRLSGRSVMLVLLFGYFSLLTLRSLKQARGRGMPRRRLMLVYVMTLVWFNSLSNFADIGENMRFRYEVAVAYHLGAMLLVARAWDWLQQRRGASATRMPQPATVDVPTAEEPARRRA